MLRIEMNTLGEAPPSLCFVRSSWPIELRGFVYTADTSELWFLSSKDVKIVGTIPKSIMLDYLVERQMKETNES